MFILLLVLIIVVICKIRYELFQYFFANTNVPENVIESILEQVRKRKHRIVIVNDVFIILITNRKIKLRFLRALVLQVKISCSR